MNSEDSSYKSEAVRRQTFHNWPVDLLDKNYLAAAGFYYTNFKDVVCCAFCKVEIKEWKQEDNSYEEHNRWSPACGFINRLNVGNKPVASNNEQPARSRDECSCSRGKHFFCIYSLLYV